MSDLEMAAVGIVYDTGGFKPNKGLKQGHFNGTKFYGEAIFDFLRLSHTVAVAGETPVLAAPARGAAALPPPTLPSASGPFFKVDTKISTLRLRREPKISAPPTANVIGEIPDGHPVRAVTGTPVRDFLEIETSLNGALLRGFASTKFLVADIERTEIVVVESAPHPPQSGIVAISMPLRPGTIIKRTQNANAHSLNEADQPRRQGTTPDELRAELARIIDWLAVDKPSHKRYQPRAIDTVFPAKAGIQIKAGQPPHQAGGRAPLSPLLIASPSAARRAVLSARPACDFATRER